MKAYRTYLTISDPKQVVLTNLPFEAGQRIEVVVLADEGNRAETIRKLEALFKRTQALPQLQTISDEDIAAEIP